MWDRTGPADGARTANYCTHKHKKVVRRLKKHPRFHMHFTRTSSSWMNWMNMVERFFADLTRDCVRAGSFRTVSELVEEITGYLAHRNENPKPYQWKADGAKTLAKIHRAREALARPSQLHRPIHQAGRQVNGAPA